MGGEKPREERKALHLSARMRCGEGWHDITICNVSSRGLMAKSWAAPARGEFIEIRHGAVCIVGQVRWSAGGRFGLRSQDRIDLTGLVTGRHAPSAGAKGEERRAAPRAPALALSPEERAEASRRFARLFDWCVMAAAVLAVAIFAADFAGGTLRAPLARVQAALASR